MSIAGKVGAVFVQQAGASVVFTDEATTDLGGTHTRYRITNTAKRYWDKSAAVTVKKNGGVITTGFTIEYAGGEIVFTVPILGTDVIVVSGKYWTVSQEVGFFSWSIEPELDVLDATTFASQGWQENLAGLKRWKASAEQFWSSSRFLDILGQEAVVVFYVDSGANKNRYEGFGIISGPSIEAPKDELIKESIEIGGVGQLYYREG